MAALSLPKKPRNPRSPKLPGNLRNLPSIDGRVKHRVASHWRHGDQQITSKVVPSRMSDIAASKSCDSFCNELRLQQERVQMEAPSGRGADRLSPGFRIDIFVSEFQLPQAHRQV